MSSISAWCLTEACSESVRVCSRTFFCSSICSPIFLLSVSSASMSFIKSSTWLSIFELSALVVFSCVRTAAYSLLVLAKLSEARRRAMDSSRLLSSNSSRSDWTLVSWISSFLASRLLVSVRTWFSWIITFRLQRASLFFAARRRFSTLCNLVNPFNTGPIVAP